MGASVPGGPESRSAGDGGGETLGEAGAVGGSEDPATPANVGGNSDMVGAQGNGTAGTEGAREQGLSRMLRKGYG